jgi:hypothetical protein
MELVGGGSAMRIVDTTISVDELRRIAMGMFGDLVKAVVDVDRELIAVDAELHSDLEALLLDDGSKQASLWGINLYPEVSGDGFIEFDSMINMRPSQGNRSRGVEDQRTRDLICTIVGKRVSE